MTLDQANGIHVGDRTRIAISMPDLTDRERAYLLEAFDSSWISSTGRFVDEFEAKFADLAGTKYALSCANGTCALHLALLALDIGPGDEVIVPDMTYVSTANAVRYVGATPVFGDCDPDTWTIDPGSVRRLTTEKTRAVVPVHLLGVPADMAALRAHADEAGFAVVEDAAEAHGAKWSGKPAGSWGDLSTFSFYGNKIITTGEGGMVCTDNERLAARVRKLKGQGADPDRRYYFDEVGYNYRMTNLACAIGLGQLERFDELIEQRKKVGRWYDELRGLGSLPITTQVIPDQADSVLWIYGIVLDGDCPVDCSTLAEKLADEGIETRPFFHPLSSLPMYSDCVSDGGCPASRRLAERGLMLPTHTLMNQADVRKVIDVVASVVSKRESVS